jgi:hypothetical protein
MKYIRYFILLAIICILGGAGFGLISLLSNMLNLSMHISIKSLLYLTTIGLIPFIAGLSKDLKKPQFKIEGLKNDYLKQVSKYQIKIDGDWKTKIKDIMNGMAYERQIFNQDYEDEKTLVYISEPVLEDIDPKKARKRNSNNRIIAEFESVEEDIKKIVEINIHKEYQYSELSNHDNEMVICKIISSIKENCEET